MRDQGNLRIACHLPWRSELHDAKPAWCAYSVGASNACGCNPLRTSDWPRQRRFHVSAHDGLLFYPSIAGVDTREAGESNDDNGMLCEMQEAKRVVSLPGSKNSRRAGNFFKIPAILGPTRNLRVELFSVWLVTVAFNRPGWPTCWLNTKTYQHRWPHVLALDVSIEIWLSSKKSFVWIEYTLYTILPVAMTTA